MPLPAIAVGAMVAVKVVAAVVAKVAAATAKAVGTAIKAVGKTVGTAIKTVGKTVGKVIGKTFRGIGKFASKMARKAGRTFSEGLQKLGSKFQKFAQKQASNSPSQEKEEREPGLVERIAAQPANQPQPAQQAPRMSPGDQARQAPSYFARKEREESFMDRIGWDRVGNQPVPAQPSQDPAPMQPDR